MKFKFLAGCQIQSPENREKHDLGESVMSGAKDDTHKSQHRSVPVSLQAFLLGKQARSSQDTKKGFKMNRSV